MIDSSVIPPSEHPDAEYYGIEYDGALVAITVRLPLPLLRRLKYAARAQERSVSALAVRLIKAGLDKSKRSGAESS